MLPGGEVQTLESTRIDRTGRALPVLVTAFPLKGDNDQVLAIATIAKDISARRQMEENLRESEARLKELSLKSIEALEADRRTVSRELHDSIGASLAALKFMLEEAADSMTTNFGSGYGTLQRSIPFLLKTIKEVKRISVNLRPLTIDDLGLVMTMKGYINQFRTQYGMDCDCHITLCEQDVPESMKIVVYRILQEALTNAGKHSRAQKVAVRLEKDEDFIKLDIKDDGDGFDPAHPNVKDPLSGYGLKSMRERVEICNGEFSIASEPGQGTLIRARLPLSAAKFCIGL